MAARPAATPAPPPDVTPAVIPQVVVVIVAFNSGPLLKKTLDALRRQSFTNFETIVWDNASSDGASRLIWRAGV